MFIAIYTAFLTWIDDTYAADVVGVDCFNERFVTGQKQENEGLDGLDRLLRETNLHYHSIQANVILTASLNFVTSTILDFETQGMKVSFILFIFLGNIFDAYNYNLNRFHHMPSHTLLFYVPCRGFVNLTPCSRFHQKSQ